MAVAIVGALTLAVGSGMLFGRDRAQVGVQLASPELQLELAARSGWSELQSAGEARAGFPGPMVWREDGLCVGFSRVDFPADDRRPTLARCVAGELAAELEPWEAVVVASVRSGLDTWVFVEVGGEVVEIDGALSGDEELIPDRVHSAGSMFALRLPEGQHLQAIEWSTLHGSYRCAPSSDRFADQWMCPEA
ncbi:MAG: hypothetical protein ACR2PK_07930 [Acidimicrobiales bacterium]